MFTLITGQVYILLSIKRFYKNNWAGETITLKEKNNELFIIRKILRSGVTGGPKYKYSTQLKSKYQIRFSTIVESNVEIKNNLKEEFTLTIVTEGKVELFLNGLQVVIEQSL